MLAWTSLTAECNWGVGSGEQALQSFKSFVRVLLSSYHGALTPKQRLITVYHRHVKWSFAGAEASHITVIGPNELERKRQVASDR